MTDYVQPTVIVSKSVISQSKCSFCITRRSRNFHFESDTAFAKNTFRYWKNNFILGVNWTKNSYQIYSLEWEKSIKLHINTLNKLINNTQKSKKKEENQMRRQKNSNWLLIKKLNLNEEKNTIYLYIDVVWRSPSNFVHFISEIEAEQSFGLWSN